MQSLMLFVVLLLIFIVNPAKADPLCGNDICDYTAVGLAVGEYTTYDSKTITLVDVGSDGSIRVQVEILSEIIPAEFSRVINGLEITNLARMYNAAAGGISTASLGIRENAETCPADCNGLTLGFREVREFCEDGKVSQETREDAVDCGGFCNSRCEEIRFCSDGRRNKRETDTDCGGPTCNKCELEKICETDSDCWSGRCYQNKCEEQCPAVQAPRCSYFLTPIGLDSKGCITGYSCCGDTVCSLNETIETCKLDCRPEEENVVEEDKTGEKEVPEAPPREEPPQRTSEPESSTTPITEERPTVFQKLVKAILRIFGGGR